MGLFYSTFKRVDFKTMIYKVIPFVVVAFYFFILFFILFFYCIDNKIKKKTQYNIDNNDIATTKYKNNLILSTRFLFCNKS